MNKEEIIQQIATRIKDEHRKHPSLDWAEIASRKIYEAHIKGETTIKFSEFLHSKYVLVETKDTRAYVNKKHNVLVNGSDYHYTRLIEEHGKNIEDIYNEWKLTQKGYDN